MYFVGPGISESKGVKLLDSQLCMHTVTLISELAEQLLLDPFRRSIKYPLLLIEGVQFSKRSIPTVKIEINLHERSIILFDTEYDQFLSVDLPEVVRTQLDYIAQQCLTVFISGELWKKNTGEIELGFCSPMPSVVYRLPRKDVA